VVIIIHWFDRTHELQILVGYGYVGYLPGLPGLLALQQQALSQHHHQAQLNGVAQDLSLPKDRKDACKLSNGSGSELLMEGVDSKKESSMMESVADVLRHAGSAFSLVRPKTEPGMETGTLQQ
jgi:homeobox protein cut-like